MTTTTTQIAANPMSAKANAISAHLQAVLIDLVELQMQAKQAHWNLYGPLFRPLHQALDAIYAELGELSDDVAERMLALGKAADGRASRVASSTRLESLPEGRISDSHAGAVLLHNFRELVSHARRSQEAVADHDAVTEDLLIELIGYLEKQAWMLESEMRR